MDVDAQRQARRAHALQAQQARDALEPEASSSEAESVRTHFQPERIALLSAMPEAFASVYRCVKASIHGVECMLLVLTLHCFVSQSEDARRCRKRGQSTLATTVTKRAAD